MRLNCSAPHESKQPQRQQAQHCRAARERFAILVVERKRVSRRVLGAGVLLAAAGLPATLALPKHHRALGPEPVAVPEHAAGKHPTELKQQGDSNPPARGR
jgi:hypothetical protein